MARTGITEEMMVDAIKSLVAGQGACETRVSQFREAFLAFGSETPDNLDAADHLDVLTVKGETGPATRYSKHLLQDIAWKLEDLQLPERLAADFPEFSEREWAAFTRLVTMLFCLLTPTRDRS